LSECSAELVAAVDPLATPTAARRIGGPRRPGGPPPFEHQNWNLRGGVRVKPHSPIL